MSRKLFTSFAKDGLRAARSPRDVPFEEAGEYLISGEGLVYQEQLRQSALLTAQSALLTSQPVRVVRRRARVVPRPYIIRFLDFPPGIRNMIYDFIFVSSEPIGSDPSHGFLARFSYKEAAKWRNLKFAMSCRQIFKESSDIFFANNCFEFFHVYQVVTFLKKIGTEGQRQIRKLKLNYRDSEPKQAFKSIRMCPNITDLDIAIELSDWSKKRGDYCQHFPIIDAKELIFGDLEEIKFGDRQIWGKPPTRRHPQTDPTKMVWYSTLEAGLEAFKRSVVWQEKKDIREAAKRAVRPPLEEACLSKALLILLLGSREDSHLGPGLGVSKDSAMHLMLPCYFSLRQIRA